MVPEMAILKSRIHARNWPEWRGLQQQLTRMKGVKRDEAKWTETQRRYIEHAIKQNETNNIASKQVKQITKKKIIKKQIHNKTNTNNIKK